MLSVNQKDDFASNGGGFYWFHGVIEDVSDPLYLGRVRVRCIGYHTDDRSLLPTSNLPWALCLLPNTSASMAGVGQSATGLQPGSWVIGFFRDGPSAQDPIIMGSVASKTTIKPDKSRGFSDPFGVNPSKIGSDIPIETQVGTGTKKKTFSQGIDLSYIGPIYPNNQVIRTRSGHVIEYDDTPGKERVSLMHKTGAFIEIAPDGSINVAGSNVNVAGSNVNIEGSSTIDLVSPTINQNTRGGLANMSSLSTLAIVFANPMPSANYSVTVAAAAAGFTGDLPGVSTITANGFTLTRGTARSYYWMAIQNTD